MSFREDDERGGEALLDNPRGEVLLEVAGLSAWYGAAHILFDVDLEQNFTALVVFANTHRTASLSTRFFSKVLPVPK